VSTIVRIVGAVALATLVSAPRVALADRVVLLPPTGDIGDEGLDAVEEALAEAIRALGHEPLTERSATHTNEEAVPETANEMRAIAEMQHATWAVAAHVDRGSTVAYWLTLRVGYVPDTRLEEIEAEVRRSHESGRLQALLAALLRATGLGHDIVDLAGEDRTGREADAVTDAERQREEERRRAEERAQEEFAERERERAEREARERWEGRERFGTPNVLVEAGLGLRPLVQTGSGGTGGTLGAVEIHVGYGLAKMPGLELRGGLDVLFGATSGFALYGGAAYLGSPWAGTPVHIGGAVELGFMQSLTGSKTGGVLLRLSPLAAWRFHDQWYLEGALPELMWVSAGSGGVTLGLSVRVGHRF
jgi:hypothetical protein